MDTLISTYQPLFPHVDFEDLISRAKDGLPPNSTAGDELTSLINVCSSKLGNHYEYDDLAGRLFLQELYARTPGSFKEAMGKLYNAGLVADFFWKCVEKNAHIIEPWIMNERDTLLTFFGMKTLCKGYLMTVNEELVERPQYMFMRVAIGIHGDDLTRVLETYELLSRKHMIHATPTLFNAGTRHAQNSSCFLLQIPQDSLDSIFDTLKNCGMISKHAGGIGISMHAIRGKGSRIKSCNGVSSGIIPMLRMFNACSRYVNQAGKRNGSIAVYLEPWHVDMEDFLELRKNYGNEEQRTRDLFTALWVSDLFMKRVETGGVWSLMCPDQCPGLNNVWGKEFETLYESYESQGKYVRQVQARDLWNRIIESQLETGMPYMLYKDHVNQKSNQQHLGTIQCSNLCTEIMQYTSADEIAVCNLCSIGLPAFVNKEAGSFDFDALHHVARVATRNLDMIIDRNFYPVKEARTSNMRHRPIGIGIQGLADTFAMMGMPFDSEDAKGLNIDIMETIYHASVTESVQLAIERGAFESFGGSPASKGIFQFDMWGKAPSRRYDWESLRIKAMKHGMRNSLLVAPMPTASTSQILGYNECFEPFTSNLYKRNTLAGEFIVLNRHLVKKLEDIGIWNEDMKNKIILANGSVQSIPGIPDEVKALFKTSWEIRQKHIIDMAADRGPYICQSQSLNLFMEEPDYQKLTAMHFYAWRKGLKTGMYYLRTRPKARAQQFTVEPTPGHVNTPNHAPTPTQIPVCTRSAGCIMCSS